MDKEIQMTQSASDLRERCLLQAAQLLHDTGATVEEHIEQAKAIEAYVLGKQPVNGVK